MESKTEKISSPEPIENLIFDLGGVLYTIDIPGALAKFKRLPLAKGFPQNIHFDDLLNEKLVQNLETGRIEPSGFFNSLRSDFGFECEDPALQDAWMAVLVGIIPGRVEMIRQIAENRRVFLLSNTNLIHYQRFETECKQLFQAFERCYFSFDMGLRKPQAGIYEKVLQENGLNPARSLFIDDVAANVKGAENVGMRGFHLKAEEDFLREMQTFIRPGKSGNSAADLPESGTINTKTDL